MKIHYSDHFSRRKKKWLVNCNAEAVNGNCRTASVSRVTCKNCLSTLDGGYEVRELWKRTREGTIAISLSDGRVYDNSYSRIATKRACGHPWFINVDFLPGMDAMTRPRVIAAPAYTREQIQRFIKANPRARGCYVCVDRGGYRLRLKSIEAAYASL